MVNTDKEQEGIANIIEARNKYRMLRTRKERTAFITKVARVFKYSRKYVIMLLGKRKKERKGRRGAPKKLREEDVQIIRQLWDLSDYMNAEYFHAGIARWISDLEKEGIENITEAERAHKGCKLQDDRASAQTVETGSSDGKGGKHRLLEQGIWSGVCGKDTARNTTGLHLHGYSAAWGKEYGGEFHEECDVDGCVEWLHAQLCDMELVI